MKVALNQVNIQLQFLSTQFKEVNDEFTRLTFEYANMVVGRMINESAVVDTSPLKEYLESVVVPLLRSFGEVISSGSYQERCSCCWRTKIECLKSQFDRVGSRYIHLVALGSRATAQPVPRSRNPFAPPSATSPPPFTDLLATPGSASTSSVVTHTPFGSFSSTPRHVVTNNARNSYSTYHSVYSQLGNTRTDNMGNFYSQCTFHQNFYASQSSQHPLPLPPSSALEITSIHL